jgi:hypothetical protein
MRQLFQSPLVIFAQITPLGTAEVSRGWLRRREKMSAINALQAPVVIDTV